MAGGIWDRIKGVLGGATDTAAPALTRPDSGTLDGAVKRKVARLFAPLAKQQRGLPDALARYVVAGDNSSVLPTIGQQTIITAWTSRARRWPPKDEAQLFTRLADWRIDQMQRLGEVLAVLEPISWDWGYFGTKKSPDWLRHVVTQWLGHGRKDQPVDTLADLVAHGGLGPEAVLDVLFCRDAGSYGQNSSVDRFAGVSSYLQWRAAEIGGAFDKLGADVRAALVASIGRFGLHDAYMPLLLDAATGSAKKVRTAARTALTGGSNARVAEAITHRFASAPPAQRAELVEVAMLAAGKEAPALLARLREGESAARVIAAFDRVSGAGPVAAPAATQAGDTPARPARPDGADGYTASDGTWVDLPPMCALPQPEKMDRSVLPILEPALAEFNRLLASSRPTSAEARWHWTKQFSPVDARNLEALARMAEGSANITHSQKEVNWIRFHLFRHPSVDQFLDDPRVTLYHLVRICMAMANTNFHGLFNEWSGPAGPALQRRIAAGADIRTVLALWAQNGGEDFITGQLTRQYYWAMPDTDIALWPAFAARFDQLDEALGMVPQKGSQPMLPRAALNMLGQFPKLPERYRARLMLLAGDSSMHVREPARELLRDTPHLGAGIAVQLGDGRQDVRALAAEWLARRGEVEQADALRAALKKDKSELARAAMISALERMGQDVSEYFAPDAMVKDATAALAKTKVKGLDWFPFDQIPALQWADGTPVDPVLPRWWITLAAKLKQPGGNALMNLWLDRLAPGHAAKLGWMVLAGWMDEDTRRPTDEVANAYAMQHVDAQLQQNIQMAKRYPQSADYFTTDRAVLFARLKAQHAGIYLGGAVDSKGVLGLATRVNGADAGARVRAFLKDHGARVSQAKALLEMLAANPSLASLQVVLAASNRSKQKSVQAHAAALIADIADRNGWTPSQMADRTVPSGGLDADGTLELDCGEGRVYTARLDSADALILFNADGREVKSLPAHRVEEERPLVETARKQLSNAKKEVKQVLAAQTDRLHEAMCLQRAWLRDDFENFIIGHAIVGRLAARLVWQGLDADGTVAGMFRPMGDGSFTNAADDDVDIAPFARMRLAHSSVMDAADVAAWRQHLADYAVAPPFDQITRQLPKLPLPMATARSITDREGWMIESFKLRGSAMKRGFQRGPAQDGGWYLTYEKTCREAGLVVEIEFTGSPLPEENRQTALQSLTFRKLTATGKPGAQMALGDVPPVLLAESWQDLHDIAAKGTGHDADWNRKAYA